MSIKKARGIVIRTNDFGEANRIVTIFTSEYGIIKATVFGAKSIKNKNSASSQFLTYADFVLNDTGKDLMTVKSCDIIESFFPLNEDLEKLSLCVYFADLIYAQINTNVCDDNILRLFLNTVYALCYKDVSMDICKLVFELKTMAYSGYRPCIDYCVGCGKTADIVGFSVKRGGIVCKNCKMASEYLIDADVYYAMKFILDVDEKKMFSFTASDEIIEKLSKISEAYVLEYSEKEFKTLEYYKQIKL